MAAADRPERVCAVVSRGGRPDLASPAALARVRAPTLLLVGSRDVEVLELNRQAYEGLRCTRKLEVIPGATHLFEEPGTLEQVARHARDWLVRHVTDARASAGLGM
jgi:pimeloyl-ACP methyl ester carboxylesterase